ncbi:MAG TPA: TIGR03087 family PEP-CTERM/XrtA system glycosyltransferase [Planctomycetota bacterium]|nr:TIGR03087 family PEP-CTERM/XrtA system glycosyltransferase [Planctomycetota bacterium]
MRILFLSQRVPYPPNRGDKITTWRLIERMRRAHEVTCVAFAHGEDDLRAAGELERLGVPTVAVPLRRGAKLRSLPLLLTTRPLTLGVYGSPRLQGEVDRLVPRAELAYAYSSSMGAFLERHAGLLRVMHFAELDSDKWRQYAERSRGPARWIYRREQRTLLELERRIARSFSENVFCTPLEQQVFQRAVPGASSIVVRNGVDLERFAPAPERSEPGHIVFTGVMDYLPNADACVHFAHEVLPRVREHFPSAHFSIVGAHPTPRVRRLARLRAVEVTGFVPDTRDWLARASVAVAPLRIARGIQNKVLEALAMGLPVVGTTAATQGIEGTPGEHYLVADDAEAEAEAVRGLLADPAGARALGMRGRRLVEERYDWERTLEPLDRLLERLAPAPLRATTP